MGARAVTDKLLLDLLDLQEVDTEIDQLLEQRQSLSELDRYKQAHGRVQELQATADEQGAALAETESQIKKAEGELEIVEVKRATEERRMFAGGFSAKDLGNLELEVEMLGRQIGTTEDDILAALEVREGQESELTATKSELDAVQAEAGELEASIAEQWRVIDEKVAAREARKSEITPLIDPELLELYEKLRPNKEGVAVGRLAEGVCGGCHLSLSSAEQVQVLAEDPPRCLHCRRILVPQ